MSDGQPVHFIHARSPEPDATPLLLVHGWPGSVFEFVTAIDPLRDPVAYGGDAADAFHVVCPSIPGYGFSGPTVEPGWGPRRIAAAFTELMAHLGYDRYGAGGGDWGAIITTELARADQGEHLIGLHLTMPLGEPPADGTDDVLSDADRAGLADWARHQAEGSVVHVPINSTRPHTLAFALNDSPAGLAAWLIDKFRAYSDCDGDIERSFTKDELLAHVTTYWLTGTIASASAALLRAGARPHRHGRAPQGRGARPGARSSPRRAPGAATVGRAPLRRPALGRDAGRRPLRLRGGARGVRRRGPRLLRVAPLTSRRPGPEGPGLRATRYGSGRVLTVSVRATGS